MKKVLIVGQGPSKNHKRGNRPLDGKGSGDKLAKLAGISRTQLLDKADTVNMLDRYWGPNGKGDNFPIVKARRRAVRMSLHGYQTVLFLGGNVARAFYLHKKDKLTWIESPILKLRYGILPHPSGVNRWYNSLENRKRAEKFLREAFVEETTGKQIALL